jgi:hypothetical protein
MQQSELLVPGTYASIGTAVSTFAGGKSLLIAFIFISEIVIEGITVGRGKDRHICDNCRFTSDFKYHTSPNIRQPLIFPMRKSKGQKKTFF